MQMSPAARRAGLFFLLSFFLRYSAEEQMTFFLVSCSWNAHKEWRPCCPSRSMQPRLGGSDIPVAAEAAQKQFPTVQILRAVS